jgi:MFS family permease
MAVNRFGPTFPRLFAAALVQELSYSLLIHVPGYFNELGATEGMIGVLYAACALAALASRPLLGRILDLTHRRTVILISSAVNIAVILGLAATNRWGPWLWGLFLLQRVFQISLFTTVLTYGADAIPAQRRTQGLAIFGLSGLLPIAIGGVLGDVVIGSFGYNALFLFSAAACIVAWFIFRSLPVLPIRGPQPRRSFWAAFAQRNLLPIWFATLLFSVGLESLFTFARTYVIDRQVGSAGLFFGAYGMFAATTRVIGGRMYDRVQHRPLVVGAIVLYGAGLGVMAAAQTTAMLLLAALVTGAAHGAAFPLLSSEVVNRARESERGSAMAIFTALFDIALLLGAPAVGFMIDSAGYTVAFGTTGLLLAVGGLAYGMWDRRMVRGSPALVGEEVH